MMTSYEVLQAINAILCGVIALRLMTFRRDRSTHKPAGGWLAYAIIVICASVPIRVAYGYHVSTDWADLLIKVLLCGALLKTRGNVMQLFTIANRGKKRENFR